jgi:hypothetical protein
MADHSTTNYYEAYPSEGYWRFKVYHYDKAGNKEINIFRSFLLYGEKEEAEDAAVEWLDANKIEAESV